MLLLITRVLVQLALLQPAPGGHPPDGDGPPRPPREAVEACSGKSSGDSCTFSGRAGETLSGTCFTPAQDKPLACRPENKR